MCIESLRPYFYEATYTMCVFVCVCTCVHMSVSVCIAVGCLELMWKPQTWSDDRHTVFPFPWNTAQLHYQRIWGVCFCIFKMTNHRNVTLPVTTGLNNGKLADQRPALFLGHHKSTINGKFWYCGKGSQEQGALQRMLPKEPHSDMGSPHFWGPDSPVASHLVPWTQLEARILWSQASLQSAEADLCGWHHRNTSGRQQESCLRPSPPYNEGSPELSV